MNATVDITRVRQLRNSIKVGVINLAEIDTFLERLEMQLPEPRKKNNDPVYCRGKLVNRPMYGK